MMNARVELNDAMMNEVVGGKLEIGKTYLTSVESGYLALRNDTAYDWTNEMGQLFNGSKVIVIGEEQGDYVMVQVVSQASGYWTNVTDRVGYVNKNYLKAA